MFSTGTRTPENNILPLDEVDEGEIVSTCPVLHFYSSISLYIKVCTISYINLNSDSLLAYTSENSTVGSHHSAEKEEAIEGGIFNNITRV